MYLDSGLVNMETVRSLVIYEYYSRVEVHDIFKCEIPFMPQRGQWGIQAVIPIPCKLGDFIFLLHSDSNKVPTSLMRESLKKEFLLGNLDQARKLGHP